MTLFLFVFTHFELNETGTLRFVKEHAASDLADVRRNALFVHTKKTRELKKYVPVIRSSWQATARRIWNDISGETRDYKVFGSQILRRNFATRMMEFWHRGKVCQDMSAAQFEMELARLMNTSTETLKTNYLSLQSTAELDHAHAVRKQMRLTEFHHDRGENVSVEDEEDEEEGESLFEHMQEDADVEAELFSFIEEDEE